MVSFSANVPAAIDGAITIIITTIIVAILAIVVVCKDVHIFVDILDTSADLAAAAVLSLILRVPDKVVKQVVHLKVKLEIIRLFVAPLNRIKGPPSLQLGLKKRADQQSNFTLDIAVLIALYLLAGERLLVISFIGGSDEIFLEVGALHRVGRLPHVELAGHG